MKSWITLLGIFFILSGCSTFLNSGSQSVLVKTEKDEIIEIEVQNNQKRYKTKTPTIIHLDPDKSLNATIRVVDPCYRHRDLDVPKSTHYSYYLNIFNLYGFFIDYATGSKWRYSEQVHLDAEPDPNARGCERPQNVNGIKKSSNLTEGAPPSGNWQRGLGATLAITGHFFLPVAMFWPEVATRVYNTLAVGYGSLAWSESLKKDRTLWEQERMLENLKSM